MMCTCTGMGLYASVADSAFRFSEAIHARKKGITRKGDFAAAWIDCKDTDNKYIEIGLAAAAEAISDAGIAPEYIAGNPRVGLVIGSSLGPLPILEDYINGIADESCLPKAMMNAMCDALCERYKIAGPTMTLTNTCVSGISAIAAGRLLLQEDEADVCIVGGIEVICDLFMRGLESLNALSSKNELKPFALDRDGIIPGEGAAFMVLRKEKTSENSYGVIRGVSISNDATHLTAPDREGRGLIQAVKEAMYEARVEPNEISAVFCGGTGTAYNDSMQAKAIQSIWSYGPEQPGKIPVTSVKPLVGHTLGASGILESISIFLMMKSRMLLPIAEHYEVDEEMAGLPLAHSASEMDIRNAVLLSSGFSGVNGALVLGSPDVQKERR